MLVLLIEQCLMLFLIVGRLMLPSDMTRDELAQLVLGYIGAAADILEFFVGRFINPTEVDLHVNIINVVPFRQHR